MFCPSLNKTPIHGRYCVLHISDRDHNRGRDSDFNCWMKDVHIFKTVAISLHKA